MDDIAGVGKIINSRVARRFYRDAISGPAQVAGETATDVAKALRLFTAPIQLAASAQDRLARWIEEATKQVPRKRQVKAPGNIAASAMEAIRFESDTSKLRDYYVRLLASCMDRERREAIRCCVSCLRRMHCSFR